jgi:FMN-dependent oxidoreductase (nitrilotriacetate monooxygenase family)
MLIPASQDENMFHFGWFVANGFALQSWNEMWSGDGGREWMTPSLYVDLARSLERARMDCIMFEDSSMVPDAYGGTSEHYLKKGQIAPKHDPFTLIPIMGQATSHIGLAATASTSFYPPFLLARLVATLDHLTNGRAGVNVVTSSSERAMQNFGLTELISHDLRYDMAQEWMDVVDALWRSWDADAVVSDEEAGIYVDHTKVRPIDYRGKFHRSRGPLNTLPPPQGRPVVFQAGGSPAGRAFGARNADIVMADAMTAGDMRSYREDIRRRRLSAGLDPDGCKVLFLVRLFVGETRGEGLESQACFRRQETEDVSRRLAGLSTGSGIDFSRFDPDQPLPTVSTEGHQSVLASFAARGAGKTLREIAGQANKLELAGDPASIADQMGELIAAVGGDGFLVMNPCTRRTIAEVADGLAPALQRRGLTRPEYASTTFRESLMEY